MRLALFLTLPLYALDQWTKWLVVRHLPFESGRTVVPGFFDLVHYGNTGAAFSLFRDANVFFIAISLVALAAIAWCAVRHMIHQRLVRIATALLAAGILGNLTDRLVRGHVVDFLLFDLHVPLANPWPAFNVADSCICVAAGLFIIQSFLDQRSKKGTCSG